MPTMSIIRKHFSVIDNNEGSWVLLDSLAKFFQLHRKDTDKTLITYNTLTTMSSYAGGLVQPAVSVLDVIPCVFYYTQEIDVCLRMANMIVEADLILINVDKGVEESEDAETDISEADSKASTSEGCAVNLKSAPEDGVVENIESHLGDSEAASSTSQVFACDNTYLDQDKDTPVLEKRYKCNICGTFWESNANLKVHMSGCGKDVIRSDSIELQNNMKYHEDNALKRRLRPAKYVGYYDGKRKDSLSVADDSNASISDDITGTILIHPDKSSASDKDNVTDNAIPDNSDEDYTASICMTRKANIRKPKTSKAKAGKVRTSLTSKPKSSKSKSGKPSILQVLHTCNVCDMEYRTVGKLRIHAKVHEEKKPYKCKTCGATFEQTDKRAYYTHRKIHPQGKQLKCEVCGKCLTSKNGMKFHMMMHTGNLPYKCDICPKSYAEKIPFEVHMKKHKGERDFVCDICGKAFYEKPHLDSHHRVHTGGKPFKCEFCGKTFRFGGLLIRHRKIHTGERPHKCSYCGKGFIATREMNDHVRTHTGEKPFKCDLCRLMFSTQKLWRRHVTVHHPKQKHYVTK